MNSEKYSAYITILKEELVPALGCTEPIAIAYASAKACEVLGRFPEKLLVKCSGNIIKNAKSVIVPNTGSLKGIKASALAGAVAGDASKEMRVLENLTASDTEKIRELLNTDLCQIEMIEKDANLHIIVKAMYNVSYALVEIIHTHTNITRIEKDGRVISEKTYSKEDFNAPMSDRSILNVKDILDFANSVKMEDVEELLERQVEYNLKIAEEGLVSSYGVNIGKMLLECYGNNILTKIRAYAAAGSDARMSGCSLPVVTNSGSGNQGMTTSLPIIIYAREKGVDKEKMYRALVLANLITIHLKTGLGRLSAFCGAVSAACGSGTGITYLEGGSLEQIEKTITNTLANVSGIVCDGAKASCAAKIASSVDAAVMAHFLAMRGAAFEVDSGIVKETVESTISAVGRLGREGMKETDLEVLKIMLDQ
ncbi:MAG: L-serine ammonia-lyase, iron-sulfur-dependent, subunit alpha [Clostridia bacterium]|nr:L-serine ammonia-lyase, iron-sulfur-dependent, subunit alpha [Clostridia bacterium]